MERARSGGVGAMLAWCGLIDVTPFFSAGC